MASKRRNTTDLEFGVNSLSLASETKSLKTGGVSQDDAMETQNKQAALRATMNNAMNAVLDNPASLIRGQMAPASREKINERKDVFNQKKGAPTWTNSFRIG